MLGADSRPVHCGCFRRLRRAPWLCWALVLVTVWLASSVCCCATIANMHCDRSERRTPRPGKTSSNLMIYVVTYSIVLSVRLFGHDLIIPASAPALVLSVHCEWRERDNLSQMSCLKLQISKRTLQEWEQARLRRGFALTAVGRQSVSVLSILGGEMFYGY